MQQVITAKQAREITGGRKPLVPVVYEEAVKALGECLTLDDAKHWDNKADALAAWAKIYHDDKVARQAKALKLHAYRRMGQLAEEMRPPYKAKRGHIGPEPGPRMLLQEHGLSHGKARAARALARMSDAKFTDILKHPRAPTSVLTGMVVDSHGVLWQGLNRHISMMLTACGKMPATTTARGLTATERQDMVARVQRIAEWCDEFLQAAGK